MHYKEYLIYNSRLSYSSAADYSVFLNELKSINKAFSSFDFSNRHYRSFLSSLEILVQQMNEAYEIWLEIGLLRGISNLSPQGLKENKYAQIFNVESISLLQKATIRLQDLGKQINSQFKICESQAKKVSEKVKNKTGGSEFGSMVSRFESFGEIAEEALFDVENIMLGSYVFAENSNKAQNIRDEVIGKEFDNLKNIAISGNKIANLERTVSEVEADVTGTSFSDEEKETIKSGVMVIKNVMPARIITAPANVVQQLKNSEQLKLNLKAIDYFLKSYNEKSEKLKFGREIAKLIMILDEAIKQENENNRVFGENYNALIKVANLVEEIVSIYNDMIGGKAMPEEFSSAVQRLTEELAYQELSNRQKTPSDVGNYERASIDPIPPLELGEEENKAYNTALKNWKEHMNMKKSNFDLNVNRVI